MIAKKHIAPDRQLILALCDNDLIGKKISEGDQEIDLGSRFYDGEEISEKDAALLMKKAYIINAVGDRSVGLAMQLGLIDNENIVRICGVPHAQFLNLGI